MFILSLLGVLTNGIELPRPTPSLPLILFYNLNNFVLQYIFYVPGPYLKQSSRAFEK